MATTAYQKLEKENEELKSNKKILVEKTTDLTRELEWAKQDEKRMHNKLVEAEAELDMLSDAIMDTVKQHSEYYNNDNAAMSLGRISTALHKGIMYKEEALFWRDKVAEHLTGTASVKPQKEYAYRDTQNELMGKCDGK